MNAIVTGGAGFIGSHITERLVKEGYSVSVIDALNTGDKKNLNSIANKIKFLKGNSSSISKLGKADVVFHEGIYSSSPMYRNNNALVGKAISEFISVLNYCVKNKCKLVFASSSSIYNGYPPPHNEEMVPKIKDFYTEARYSMERLAELFSQMYGLEYCGLRYFSVYGDREESKKEFANMVSQIIWKGLLDKELVIYGDGTQRRDLVNVADVVAANLLASKSKENGIFNVGTGVSYSFNDTIEKVGNVMGKKIKTKNIENPLKNYVDVVHADTKKSLDKLGFSAKINIDDGIKAALDYYKNLKKVPDIF
ncbi:MAG: NAD-dependent epimerase/dehydratase family protein [Candidatus Parvarchaeota archaeon]|jgi:UDP-glucose 4-epimerase|nr:NAD-dependent epimerase/dehydratase family protein [Candidatus Parvarchaeota archaeon]